MTSPVEKIRRTLRFHYYRLKNGWAFPDDMAHLTAGNMARGTYEPEVSALIGTLLSEGDLFIDVGANVGYFTRFASDIVGSDGLVVAFEAESDNFHALARNIRPYRNIAAVHMAVSDQNRFLNIRRSSHSSCHSIVETGNYALDSEITVPAISLDHFWQFYLDERPVSLLKVDVEGAELLVLEGMTEMLSRQMVENLIIEFCPEILENAGFRPEVLYRKLKDSFHITLVDKEYREVIGGEKIDSPEQFEELSSHLMSLEGIENSNLWCRRKEN